MNWLTWTRVVTMDVGRYILSTYCVLSKCNSSSSTGR